MSFLASLLSPPPVEVPLTWRSLRLTGQVPDNAFWNAFVAKLLRPSAVAECVALPLRHAGQLDHILPETLSSHPSSPSAGATLPALPAHPRTSTGQTRVARQQRT